ncbi:MAG: hypothetical protein LBM08_09885 [Dysgonamonadaceae bacterium]|jgi:hypothetical protein|nr:hypothetical protein [Dysgonamonadaceae bacterium]
MYKRFLNNQDYLGIITERHLGELIREDEKCLEKAEEAAEGSILEYLTENYEVENALATGKGIREYNPQITYPAGAYFYRDGRIWETLRTVNGRKSPSGKVYWEEFIEVIDSEIPAYSQLVNYNPEDVVVFANVQYRCLEYNGPDFGDIRIPGLAGWEQVTVYGWEANWEYEIWEVACWSGRFYALLNTENIDLTQNPEESDNWGLIGQYDPEYNGYEFSGTEYVVFDGKVYAPTMEVNSDEIREGYNIRPGDPRNLNLKKYMLRIAVYELHKLISPNNVSQIRIVDYEESLRWLRDASKLRINPQIPRKLDSDSRPVTDWQVATFQKDYDPYKNPWQI